MRALTKKSPARRNHAVLAYSEEHLSWVVTTIVYESVPCFKQITACVMSSATEDVCSAGDGSCVSTCEADPCPEEEDD